MFFEKLLENWPSLFYGIIVTLTMLPITSDLVRARIFNQKSSRIASGNKELIDVSLGIISSGQHLEDCIFSMLVNNIAKKYNVSSKALLNRNAVIATLIQIINTSYIPEYTKRDMSNKLKFEYFSDLSSSCHTKNFSVDDSSENREPSAAWTRYSSEFEEPKKIFFENNRNSSNGYGSVIIPVCLGLLIAIITCWNHNSLFIIIPELCSFFLSINILYSLVIPRVIKGTTFYKRLVYKIVLLMIIAVLGIVAVLASRL